LVAPEVMAVWSHHLHVKGLEENPLLRLVQEGFVLRQRAESLREIEETLAGFQGLYGFDALGVVKLTELRATLLQRYWEEVEGVTFQ
jgi:hypothetical protein